MGAMAIPVGIELASSIFGGGEGGGMDLGGMIDAAKGLFSEGGLLGGLFG